MKPITVRPPRQVGQVNKLAIRIVRLALIQLVALAPIGCRFIFALARAAGAKSGQLALINWTGIQLSGEGGANSSVVALLQLRLRLKFA